MKRLMKQNFYRTLTLWRMQIWRNRYGLLCWLIALGLFTSGYVPAFEKIAEDQGLQGMYLTMKNPAMIAMVGTLPVKNAADYTIGAMYGHEMTLFFGIVSMLIAGLYMINQTRKQEENGLTEMLGALNVGRRANDFASLGVVLCCQGLLIVFIVGVMLSFQVKTIDVIGSLHFAGSLAFAGLLGAALAYCFAQIFPTSSMAKGYFLGVVGLLYLLRALTDITHPNWSAFNPVAWLYLNRPFTENKSLYLLGLLFLTIVFVGAGFYLANHRDLQASYLPTPKGKATANALLLSVSGWLHHVNGLLILSWYVGYLVLGAAYGSIYGQIDTFISSNHILKQMFAQNQQNILDAFTAMIMIVLAALSLILPLLLIQRLANEEKKQRLAQLLALPISRSHLYWVNTFWVILYGSIGLIIGGFALASAAYFSLGKVYSASIQHILIATFHQLPLMLFFIGAMSLCFGWLPQLSGVIYGYLGYSFVLAYFQSLLHLPKWLVKTSAFHFLADYPLHAIRWLPSLLVGVLGLGFILIGWLGFSKRNLR